MLNQMIHNLYKLIYIHVYLVCLFCIHKRPNDCTNPRFMASQKKSIAEEKFKILKKIKNLQIKNRRIRENFFLLFQNVSNRDEI